MKLRTNVRRAYVLALLALSVATRESAIVGAGLILLGCLLHLFASGYLAKEQFVVTGGPYRFVRNPFYVANVLIDGGLGVVASGLHLGPALIPIPIFFALFYLWIIPRRVRMEEESLRKLFGETYDEYCRRVPRYLPSMTPRIETRGRFSLQNIARNREVPRFINSMLLAPLLMLASRVKELGFKSLPNDLATQLLAASILLGYGIAIGFRLALRPKMPINP